MGWIHAVAVIPATPPLKKGRAARTKGELRKEDVEEDEGEDMAAFVSVAALAAADVAVPLRGEAMAIAVPRLLL